MGAGEEGTPTKQSKPTSSVQERNFNLSYSEIDASSNDSLSNLGKEVQTTPSYPDRSSSMQAFYGAGAPPAFYASTVGSPTPHPYMWGGQHPLMLPYGTPVPYPALYPPGGVYVHPSIVTNSKIAANGESEGKAADGKDRNPAKRSKGDSGPGLSGGKAGDSIKAASSSENDGATQSAESGSDGSSDASDENANHELSASKKGSFHQMLADGASAQNGANVQTSVPGNPVVSMPASNLNIGMDLWNTSPAGNGSLKVHSNPSGALAAETMIVCEMPDQWVNHEREHKRQKRKQSNLESARRSRLRKQTECEELQIRVETLSNENGTLRDELKRLAEECEKITSENNSIKEELSRIHGPDEVSELGIQDLDDGGNS